MLEEYLTKEDIEEVYKDIRTNPRHMKHAERHKQLMMQGKYTQAAIEAKVMKEIEVEVFSEIAKNYINSNKFVANVIGTMSDDDKRSLNILANSMFMLTDVLNILVIDADSIFQKYNLGKMKDYDRIKELLKESNKRIAHFDSVVKDEKASMLFGECSDSLYKMIFNKASSYVNKLKKYEESVNKKTARNAKVA